MNCHTHRYSNVTTLKDALVHAAAKSDAALRLNAETALTQLPPLPGKLLLHTSSALDKREAALSSWLKPSKYNSVQFGFWIILACLMSALSNAYSTEIIFYLTFLSLHYFDACIQSGVQQ